MLGSATPSRLSAMQFIALIVAVFGYFLLFAQFGFLAMLELEFGKAESKQSMALLLLGGVFGSLLTGGFLRPRGIWSVLFTGFSMAFLAPGLSLAWPTNRALQSVVGGLTGVALGLLTVSLVCYGATRFGSLKFIKYSALGTGLAYGLCNIPAVFKGGYTLQAIVSTGFALLGGLALMLAPMQYEQAVAQSKTSTTFAKALGAPQFVALVLGMLALIMTDSAAFYAQQHSVTSAAELGRIWAAAVHVVGALAVIGLVKALRWPWILGMAFIGLLAGHLLKVQTDWAVLGDGVYFCSVSLYSVLLIVGVALVGSDTQKAPTWRVIALRASVLYAIAGWIGSSAGIGMVQDLGRIPRAYWIVATAVCSLAIAVLLKPSVRRTS